MMLSETHGKILKKIEVYLFLITASIICFIVRPKIFFTGIHAAQSSQTMQAHFLDVGDGDCSYIKCGKVNILIDAGAKTPKGKIVKYLKKYGVKKLNLVVVSHPHADHIGQMEDVLTNFKVDKIIEPEMPNKLIPTTVTYEKMLKAIKKNKVTAKVVKVGSNFSIGGLKIEVVGPVTKNAKKLNNQSIVFRVTYKDVKFLFAGDAEKQEESEILNCSSNKVANKKSNKLKANVLKVGHHGSDTSTTDKFLKAVSPKYAVISVSKKKHKSRKAQIENKLKKYCGKRIYVTGNSGNIVFTTDGKKINVKKAA